MVTITIIDDIGFCGDCGHHKDLHDFHSIDGPSECFHTANGAEFNWQLCGCREFITPRVVVRE